jgi:Uncharacterised nucleotidyltransferase
MAIAALVETMMSRAGPRPERQLILLSARTVADRRHMRARAERLAGNVEWPRLAEMLRGRRLLPCLGPRILEMVGTGVGGEQFARAVGEAIEVTRRHATFLQLVAARVRAALVEADIQCSPLKGTALAELLYGDPGRRPSRDIDLLVAPGQLRAAVEVVRALGYELASEFVDACSLPKLHFLLSHPDQKLPPVELHWRVHYYERRFAHERLLAPSASAGDGWRPHPADELISLLLFYSRDGFIDLRLAADVSAWWDMFGSSIQPGMVERRLEIYDGLTRVVTVAIKVAEKVVGLPAAQILGAQPALDLRQRLAVRLANPHPRSSEAQLYADIGLVDGLLAPPGGLRAFVRRQLLLPREVLDELDRRAPKRRARSSIGRGLGVLGRFALTVVRLALLPRERPSEPRGRGELLAR